MVQPATPDRPAGDARGRHAIQTYALDRDPRATNAPGWLVGAARVPDVPGRGWAASAAQARTGQRADTALGPALVARAIADGGQPRLTQATVVELQRTIGNAGVTRLLVARCPDGEVPPEGCAECGKSPAQRQVAQAFPVQREAGDRPTIRFGSTGPAVSELQSRLVNTGASIEVDGDFGGRTLKAVKATQSAAGLSADGIVGPKTWGALDVGVQLPGGGTPPRGYRALLDQVGAAIGALRGAVPAGAEAPVSSIGSGRNPLRHALAQTATGATGAAVPTAPAAVQREDEEDEESLWDQATDAASGVLDEASEAAGEAWDAGAEAAGEVWDAGAEAAGEVWDAGAEAAGEVWDAGAEAAGEVWDAGAEAAGEVWDAGAEAAGGAWESTTDAAEQLWDGATQVVESFVDEVAGIPGALRERFGSEIAALEQVIKSLGQGFRLTDEEIAGMTKIVTGLMDGLDVDVTSDIESTCAAATQAVAFSQSSFKVSFEGLSDLNTKVSARLGGSAGHVNLAAFPSFTVTCWDGTGPSRTVGAAKVTAKGSATFPTPAEADEAKWRTQSADRPREIIGIRNYFSIVSAHEGEHVRIYKDAFSGAADQLKGLTESEAKTKFNSITCEAFKSQDSLDNSEGCVEVFGGKDSNKAGASACGLTPNAASSCP